MLKPLVTSPAPFFKAQVYNPLKKAFVTKQLTDYKGKYLLLTFYPLDFTFVCPTEIVELSKMKQQFSDKNCELLCCSTDSHFSHKAWAETPKSQGGFDNKLQIELMSDFTKQIARDYGVLLEDSGIALRGTFLIDPEQKVRHATINDLPVGRNMEEFLRVIDAFDFVAKHGEVCPAKWKKKGDPTLEGNHSEKKTKEYWNKDFDI